MSTGPSRKEWVDVCRVYVRDSLHRQRMQQRVSQFSSYKVIGALIFSDM